MSLTRRALFAIITIAFFVCALRGKLNVSLSPVDKNMLFLSLFIFRYLRLVVHITSYWFLYCPSPIKKKPLYKPCDVTVIVPTIDPENRDFGQCISSILANKPKKVMIVTVGSKMATLTENILKAQTFQSYGVPLMVLHSTVANKRNQMACAIPRIQTPITVFADDHVFWRSRNFLPIVLAAFEDPEVGGVGTNKRVIRSEKGFNAASFWNMIGAIYLERQNFDVRATNAIDGGVFVNSGRTYAHRTKILQSEEFLKGFLNERFLFGIFGPLNCDDDNFITRFEFKNGWKIKIQHCEDGLVETRLGTYPKFISQCLRWVRTTWRSNPASLFTERTAWKQHPWCTYAVYFTSFVNFALFYDAGLFCTLSVRQHGKAGRQ